ncbi:MAG: hypothetical protein CV087_20790 [Candidatus Brocadia sp. WS118]|nr:MAG: hypothetical protein CV087_20790 [Candidatus Brocadia sp. WS118]
MQCKWHFDDCYFAESTENINEQYEKVLTNLNPDDADFDDALDEFGKLLHTVQDFYSHSNWVEMKKGGFINDELIDNGLSLWTILNPLSITKGLIVVEGEEYDMPEGTILTRDGRIVRVTTKSSERLPGLISGTFALNDHCPDNIEVSHDYLNKDERGRPYHSVARELATRQTVHEWCRLINLVNQAYGQKGVKYIFDNLIKDKAFANCVCFPLYRRQTIYVDQAFSGPLEMGTADNPFRSFEDGVESVLDQGSVLIYPGNYIAEGNYSKEMTLQAPLGEVVLK